jgi:NADPH:quinone reductase-like Zn-dependent oxidoreductase
MRAWQVVEHGEPKEVMVLGEKAVPEPGPGEIRILVKAAALGLPDVFMCRGTYAFSPAIPFTPGQEVVGIVTAAGEGVDLTGALPSRPSRRSVRHTLSRKTCPMRTRPLSSSRFKRPISLWPDAGN